MRDRLLISKEKIKDLYIVNELDFEFKDLEYEYYSIIVATISYISKDRKIFKKNKDLYEFLDKVFDFKIEFKMYVKKNKSILIGKTLQYVSNNIEKNQYEKYANKLNRELNELISPKRENYLKFLQGINR